MDKERLSDAQIDRLTKLYESAEKSIMEQINSILLQKGETASLSHIRGLNRNIDHILISLKKGSKQWCTEAMPQIYTQGLKNADILIKDMGGKISPGFSNIHQQAVQVLAENTYGRFEDVTEFIGRRTDDIFRNLALENVRGTVVGYETWGQVARNYRAQLAEQGITGFIDKAGRQWNMGTYSKMVARTTTMECYLQGTNNRLLEQGHDLIRISSHGGACELCVPWEGEVLSLTGKTEGYPTLEEAKAQGLFHPNCRHAYGLHIDLDAEIEKMDEEK